MWFLLAWLGPVFYFLFAFLSWEGSPLLSSVSTSTAPSSIDPRPGIGSAHTPPSCPSVPLELLFLITATCQVAQICFTAWTAPLPGGASGKEPTYNAGDIKDAGSIPGSGRSPGGGNGNPLQYSYLENPMDRGTWQATVHGVAESWTRLKRFNTRMAKSHLPSV